MFNVRVLQFSHWAIRLGQSNVKKYVGIAKYLSKAKAWYKNFFQYGGVTLTEFIKNNALLLATNMSIVSL